MSLKQCFIIPSFPTALLWVYIMFPLSLFHWYMKQCSHSRISNLMNFYFVYWYTNFITFFICGIHLDIHSLPFCAYFIFFNPILSLSFRQFLYKYTKGLPMYLN